MPVLRILIILTGIFAALSAGAQQTDSLTLKPDTLKPLSKPAPVKQSPPVVKNAARLELEKMPRRAALRSAIIPGWGQLTNKRWWKVPLVYGGFVGIALVYDFNQTNYKTFLTEAQDREFNRQNQSAPRLLNPAFEPYDDLGIIRIKDGYRRNRDLTILGGVAFYTITIIDAYIDAKFFRFDISDELALKVKPALQQQPVGNAFAAPVPSVKLSLSLSK